ncbi:hypothetical protein SE19_08010 [Acidiplasma aeolicum]|uniref:SMP-30/Gluconolactonase/LRE-like region domain-containing protein n=1 Tax=Acidiplasma aeolicum TaxID=507754 RepID=A0A0P9F337_9ARCH|nr:SMP-30/gluconolactonase/LRE family protein [Acidiplasma aeolicum]KPV45868.1 hypothetical protein SE19_08010 [Acidiplasma aeolicum]KQB34632.1 hypothetical protein AOG54_04235 [Acidiplasma aeolicum]
MYAKKIEGAPHSSLGESPMFFNDTLYWIDINSGTLHSMYKNTFSSVKLDEIITFIAPHNDGIIYSTRNSINFYNTEKAYKNALFKMDFQKNVRFNDGKCDHSGRLFAGTMDINEKNPIGKLYKFEKEPENILENVIISNGMAWSMDGSTMYYIDSPTRKIRVFNYDNINGEIISEGQSIDVSASPGVPDGMTIDSEDNIYVAFFGGSHVLKLNKSGKILLEIELDAENVSCCTFGGDDFRTLFITTAFNGRNGGGIYMFNNDVPGIKPDIFKF